MSREEGGGARSLEQYMRSRLGSGHRGGGGGGGEILEEEGEIGDELLAQEMLLRDGHVFNEDELKGELPYDSQMESGSVHEGESYSAEWRDTKSMDAGEDELVSSSSLADMAAFAPQRQSLTVDTSASGNEEGELEGSSVSVFDTSSEVVTAIFTPRGIDAEAVKEAAAAAAVALQTQQLAAEQIHNLEMDVVTLMEEVDALGQARRDAEAKGALLAEENAALSETCTDLKLQLRESRDKVFGIKHAIN